MGQRATRNVHSTGELCVGGDWACAHGDLSGLADIAKQLAIRVHEPLHCELLGLVDLCRTDSQRAVAEWVRLKDALFEQTRHAR